MKNWFKFFRIWFLVCGIIIIVCAIMIARKSKEGSNEVTERINTYCTESERVFDYGDVLSDEEENNLRALIAEKEIEAKCDIVLLTMNESLEEYAKKYNPYVESYQYVMIKADNFYDEYGFGWNKTKESDDGDGCILLDNWYRESDGKIHTWLSTSGTVETDFSSDMIDEVLDHVYEDIEYDPYEAYRNYVLDIAKMRSHEGKGMPGIILYGVPIAAAVIFMFIYMSTKEGKKTTTEATYVGEGGIDFSVMQDQFITKTVTSRIIPRSDSSGGGGGGHHYSSGGHSHGGGGHSR